MKACDASQSNVRILAARVRERDKHVRSGLRIAHVLIQRTMNALHCRARGFKSYLDKLSSSTLQDGKKFDVWDSVDG